MAYPRRRQRWGTRFGSWVNRTGVSVIVAHLERNPKTRVTKRGAYKWLEGHLPRAELIEALVELGAGEISVQDFYDHRQAMQTRGEG